ncbi:MAG: hypothetical protein HY784_09070 [Chloroflexi bacterium]|nr:hypothetical protein [Chloroflexota bacterium]
MRGHYRGPAGIRCPIDLFPRQEAEIARLTAAINRARPIPRSARAGSRESAPGKVPRAQELIEAVEVLLACERYDESSIACRLCRNFSQLRRKTAALVVKAERLSR